MKYKILNMVHKSLNIENGIYLLSRNAYTYKREQKENETRIIYFLILNTDLWP